MSNLSILPIARYNNQRGFDQVLEILVIAWNEEPKNQEELCHLYISSGADAAYGEGRLPPPYPNSTPQNVRIPAIASRVCGCWRKVSKRHKVVLGLGWRHKTSHGATFCEATLKIMTAVTAVTAAVLSRIQD